MFSCPEEKLWIVAKEYQGGIPKFCQDGTRIKSDSHLFAPKRGVKLEKNSVIKLGRVRLRVRDIDYKVDADPVKGL